MPNAMKQSIGGTINKTLSPFNQKKQELDASMQKVDQPFQMMQAQQQQIKMSMDAAQQQTESAKKILDTKEMMFSTSKDATNKTLNDAQSTLQKANQGIDSRQKEFQNAGEQVKELIAKIEAQVKSTPEVPGRIPGAEK